LEGGHRKRKREVENTKFSGSKHRSLKKQGGGAEEFGLRAMKLQIPQGLGWGMWFGRGASDEENQVKYSRA